MTAEEFIALPDRDSVDRMLTGEPHLSGLRFAVNEMIED
jgi:hypothetical protein